MDETETRVILGFIILLLIINSTVIWSDYPGKNIPGGATPVDPRIISPTDPPVQYSGDSVPMNSAVGSDISVAAPVPATVTSSPVPETGNEEGGAAASANSSDTQVSSPIVEVSPETTDSSWAVTVGQEEEQNIERHEYPQPELARRSEDGYVTLYSLTNQPLRQTMPHVYFDLRNPPLVVEYDVIPPDVTREKWIQYNNQTYDHPGHIEAIVSITRPSDLTWAEIIVRNKDSGQIVGIDGFGKTYSLESPREIVIRKPGNYDFEFNGEFGMINLTMRAPRMGNIAG